MVHVSPSTRNTPSSPAMATLPMCTGSSPVLRSVTLRTESVPAATSPKSRRSGSGRRADDSVAAVEEEPARPKFPVATATAPAATMIPTTTPRIMTRRGTAAIGAAAATTVAAPPTASPGRRLAPASRLRLCRVVAAAIPSPRLSLMARARVRWSSAAPRSPRHRALEPSWWWAHPAADRSPRRSAAVSWCSSTSLQPPHCLVTKNEPSTPRARRSRSVQAAVSAARSRTEMRARRSSMTTSGRSPLRSTQLVKCDRSRGCQSECSTTRRRVGASVTL